jgi:hypothetical protein
MFIPMWMLVILIILAIPTVILIGGMLHAEASKNGLCFFGRREIFHSDCTRTWKFCVFYIPVSWGKGYHSTAWLD